MFEDPISTYMKTWLNTTYEYLRQTGGPTYPAPTVGPNVEPGGPASSVVDYPVTYGFVPMPFNPAATGIPATANSQPDAVDEIARQNPPPTTFSKYFGLLYGDMMNACIADQRHRACNPNTISACRDLAERGDTSGMILTPWQRTTLGISPSSPVNNKSDNVHLAENEATLTAQIGAGYEKIGDTWAGFTAGLGQGIRMDPSGDNTFADNPKGVNFQAIGKNLQDFIPSLPNAPSVNTGSVVMIGGAIILIVLLIAVVK